MSAKSNTACRTSRSWRMSLLIAAACPSVARRAAGGPPKAEPGR